MNEIIMSIIHGTIEDQVIFGSLAVLALVGVIATLRFIISFMPLCGFFGNGGRA